VESLFSQIQSILRQLEDIRRQVYQNTALLHQLGQRPTQNLEEVQVGELFELPVTSVGSMEALDQWLNVSANYKALVITLQNFRYMH